MQRVLTSRWAVAGGGGLGCTGPLNTELMSTPFPSESPPQGEGLLGLGGTMDAHAGHLPCLWDRAERTGARPQESETRTS